MSSTTVLSITPNQRPEELAEFRNSHGWGTNIWERLVRNRGFLGASYGPEREGVLNALWGDIEILPEWQQAAMILTFDVGVVPHQAFDWLIEGLEEFETRLPSPEPFVNHVPAMIELLRSKPEAQLIGVWGTSCSDNPFDPWDGDAPGNGIPLSEMYLLPQHRRFVTKVI